MTKNVITISREFGSGGRTIGNKVVEALGIEYYDRDIIKHVVEETGLSQKFVEAYGEYAPSQQFAYNFVDLDEEKDSPLTLLWEAQQKVIRELADKGPCVIVGSCADWILRDREDVLRVFLFADEKTKLQRIKELYGDAKLQVRNQVKDTARRRYIKYQYYTGQEWGKAENYDLLLNRGTLGIDKCVEIILDAVK